MQTTSAKEKNRLNATLILATILSTLAVVQAPAVTAAESNDMIVNPGPNWPPRPTVVGHRGAPAHRPEHTLASYEKAIADGADIIEPDLVISKDGVLVVRHENEIGGTTDIAKHPEFADRKTTKQIDGQPITGWFTEDFTLAELKTLRARERIPDLRPANTAYDGQFSIPTLAEVIDLAQRAGRARGSAIGIYPETKHSTYFKSIGLPLERRLVEQMHAAGYRGKAAAVIIQSFEPASLKEMRALTGIHIMQLIDNPKGRGGKSQPYDFTAAGDTRSYADMITPTGLKDIALYADIVAPTKDVIIPRDAGGHLTTPTRFVADAHAAGLLVHMWTLRPENNFLPTEYRKGTAPGDRGNGEGEILAFLQAGIDGFFTDDPAVGRAAVTAYRASR
jgi:glycerophosphoryl diester phosphodiesterase